ncbi:putative DNA topoisomerase, partial [Serratia symbiotica str. Tucson]
MQKGRVLLFLHLRSRYRENDYLLACHKFNHGGTGVLF